MTVRDRICVLLSPCNVCVVLLLQYYYNSQTQQFLYWDGVQQTYLPAPTQGSAPQTAGALSMQGVPENKETKDKEKKQKVQVAKKIAKASGKYFMFI